ncbi:hypothetical protein REIFOR_01543 [Reinekea forsetii]|uniref:Uncharacterized protein n=1 Tax=Reinekea forsetii TaxID=1336806 RepID=A0A2K8KPJ4_9GAMM|nr:hypothetical protein REIFOR_01543 [Reinekea forsetii]
MQNNRASIYNNPEVLMKIISQCRSSGKFIGKKGAPGSGLIGLARVFAYK